MYIIRHMCDLEIFARIERKKEIVERNIFLLYKIIYMMSVNILKIFYNILTIF